MSKSKKGIIVSVILMTVMVIAVVTLWKVPVLIGLNNINIPENCEEIKTEVVLTDVYEWHILGEKVFKCDDGYESVKKYVEANNSKKDLAKIHVAPFFREWDDFAVFPNDYYDKVNKEDYDKYCVLVYYIG